MVVAITLVSMVDFLSYIKAGDIDTVCSVMVQVKSRNSLNEI